MGWFGVVLDFTYADEERNRLRFSGRGIVSPKNSQEVDDIPDLCVMPRIYISWDDIDCNFDPSTYEPIAHLSPPGTT